MLDDQHADTVCPRWVSRWAWLCFCGHENWRWDKVCIGRHYAGCQGQRPAKRRHNDGAVS